MERPAVLVVGKADGLAGPLTLHLARTGRRVAFLGPHLPRWRWPGITARSGDPAEATAVAATLGCRTIVVADGLAPLAIASGSNIDRLVAVGGAAPPFEGTWTWLDSAPVVGRRVGDATLAALARLFGGVDPDGAAQVVHVDDISRLVADACAGRVDGRIGVAAPGAVPAAAVARALGIARPSGERILAAADGADLSRIGFTPVWSATEAIDDLAMAAVGVRIRTGGFRRRTAARVPSSTSGPPAIPSVSASEPDAVQRRTGRARFVVGLPAADEPAADGRPLVHCAPEDLRGEFDTAIDPRFPAYSAVNLSEALPGPATPFSLSTVGRGTAAATTAFIDLVGVGGVLGTESWARGQAVLGHRVFVNLSFAISLARIVPGMDVDAMADEFVGRSASAISLEGEEPVPDEAPRGLDKVRFAARIARTTVGLLRSHRSEATAFARQVTRLGRLASDPAGMTDARLESVSRLAQDLQLLGWLLGGRNVLAVQALLHPAEALHPGSSLVSGGASDATRTKLASAAALVGVQHLAAAASREPAVAEILAAGGADLAARCRAVSPAFARHLDEALTRFGHRAPGEGELANPRFAEDPDALLRIVSGVLSGAGRGPAAPAQPGGAQRDCSVRSRLARRLMRRADRLQVVREDCRDALVKVMAVQRRLALEQGRRLVAAGVISDADDAFYLSLDELFRPPDEAAALVRRRREERSRLGRARIPTIVSATWEPVGAIEGPACAGDRLTGLGAAPGQARGRVRITTLDTIADFEPGEILVARATDVGYTPLFALAAAVVTDVGGAMSHAAVVAREYGIPAVTDTATATSRLTTGMLIAVDGSTGDITVVDTVTHRGHTGPDGGAREDPLRRQRRREHRLPGGG